MKNIFSNFGTKKVAGVVLAGATLMVGLGVVSNFSDGSQKAANEAALSRFGGSSYNTVVGSGSSASRADLERQMSATQGGYSARFLKGKSSGTEPEDAFSSDGAYAEGIRSADSSYGGEGGAYQSFDSTYEQGADGMEFRGDSMEGPGYGEAQFQAAQEAAAAAVGKGVKGKGATSGGQKGQLRPATQINKLAASKGGSSFSGGAGAGGGVRGGSSGFMGSGSSSGSGDNNTRALPQARTGQPDGNAFKLGRAGGMGGFNVGFNGNGYRGGHAKGRGAASDLQIAMAYSGKAVATRQSAGAKALAEAAFDGSNPEDLTPTIEEGASIDKVASSLMKGMDIDMPEGSEILPPDLEDNMQELLQQQQELSALQQKISKRLLLMIGIVAAAAIGLFFLVKAAYAAPAAWWLWVAAGVLSLAALGTIAGMLWWGDNSIVNMIKQLGDNNRFGLVNQGVDVGGKLTDAYTLSGGLAAMLGLCWLPWSNISSTSTFVQGLIKTGATTILGKVGSDTIKQISNISANNKKST